MRLSGTFTALLIPLFATWPAQAQDSVPVVTSLSGDSVRLRVVDAELRVVVQALGRHLDRPLLLGAVPDVRVTLDTPRALARRDVASLLRGLLDSYSHELIADSAFYRVRPREPTQPSRAATGAGDRALPELRVIRLRHARATEVAATLMALFGVSGGDIVPVGRAGTLSDELRRNTVPPVQPGGQSGARQPGGPAPRAAVLEAPVTIVPDQVSNQLLIRATARDADLLAAAVAEIDVRPLQVLIEVVIAEVRRDRQTAYGLQWTLPDRSVRSGNTTVGASQSGGGLGDFVVRMMNLGRGDIDAVLQAGTTSGDVDILSRPVILAANNQEATFLVGAQRPFVQVSRSLPTDGAARDQVVQYKDVGTRLVVRPTISADGFVTLDVTQEVSSATAETAFDAPVISTREARTQVLVRNGQTIVLGGLIDRQRETTSGGIPLLSSIPLVGGLFGRRGQRASSTELFLFLTPRILATDADVDGATDVLRTRVEPDARTPLLPPVHRP